MRYASANPKNVENSKPINTFCHPLHSRAEGPATASPAPVKPEIRAWLSLVGKPYFQAKVLHEMIAIIAAATVVMETISALIIPLPIVLATSSPENVPAIFKVVARITAVFGESTRVETTVAMEFGASVHPFTNSAQRISINTNNNTGISTIN